MSGPLVAKRLAIKLEPPTVYLEYSSVDSSLRRVRAVKLLSLYSTSNSRDLEKLTDKVIKGFPKDLDQSTINRQQIQGLLAQLLLSLHQQQDPSAQTSSKSEALQTSHASGCECVHQLDSYSQPIPQQQQTKQLGLGAQQTRAEHGTAVVSTAPIQTGATAHLEQGAPGWTPDNQDDSSSQQQRRRQRTSVRGAVDPSCPSISEQQQSGSSYQTLQQQQQQQRPADPNGVRCDLLSALSDIQAELGEVDGSGVCSLSLLPQQQAANCNQCRVLNNSYSLTAAGHSSCNGRIFMSQQQKQHHQPLPEAPLSIVEASIEAQQTSAVIGATTNGTAAPGAAAVMHVAATDGQDDDEDDCLTLEADFLAAEDVDLNKATEYELRLAKAEMDKKFRQNIVQPGQVGYVYDKQADFQPAAESNEWDDD